jgi:uncharacterized protein YPO0396
MSDTKNSIVRQIAGLVVGLLFAGVAAFIMLNRQYVVDQVAVWQYTPSPAVAQLAQRATIADKGLFYFYASQPSVEGTQKFNSMCDRKEPTSAILGCYSAQRIYIYDVTDPRLDGIREVTASHEMLHAVFERLSDEEKARLGVLLEAEYAKLNNKDLQSRMEYYARSEPGDRINELHSIIGTEVASISPELEAHYKLYFSDRQKMVALHTTYQKVFDDLSAQATTLADELTRLRNNVSAEIEEYNASAERLEADVAALKAREATINRTSAAQVNAYNADRQTLIDRIDALNRQKADIDAKTNEFNTKLSAYNDLVVRSNELKQKIDSTLAPAPSI